MGLPLQTQLHKGVKNTDSPVKKKFWVQLSVKKVMLTVFFDMKGFITTDLLEKVMMVNST